MAVKVYELEFDDDNEAEMWHPHRVTPREVVQVLDRAPKFFPNKKGHSATLLMIGRTDGGRLLTVPLAACAVEGLWRPATAFGADPHEQSLYAAAGGL